MPKIPVMSVSRMQERWLWITRKLRKAHPQTPALEVNIPIRAVDALRLNAGQQVGFFITNTAVGPALVMVPMSKGREATAPADMMVDPFA